MKTTTTIHLQILLWGLALAGCSESETIHVRSGEAELPVFIQQPDRPVLLVFETGGPSGTAIDGVLAGYYPWEDCFGPQVSVASYDRRGTGNARGLRDDSSIRIENYEADLLAVTRSLSDSGVRTIGLGALGYDARPDYCRNTARKLRKAGMDILVATPEELAGCMAKIIRG